MAEKVSERACVREHKSVPHALPFNLLQARAEEPNMIASGWDGGDDDLLALGRRGGGIA